LIGQHEVTYADLSRIMDDHPKLSAFGYDHPDVRNPADLDRQRARLLGQLDDVQAAHAWLSTLYPEPDEDQWSTSYTLKHDGERSGQLGYVMNGAMIAAALLAELPMRITPGHPNPFIGVSITPPRPQPTAGSFTAWLDEYRGDNSLIGDLADDVEHDDTWPIEGDSYDTFYTYLTHMGASDGALRALHEAWTSYSGHAPDIDDDF